MVGNLNSQPQYWKNAVSEASFVEILGLFDESEFEILGSQHPTPYPATGKDVVLDAAPSPANLFFLHTELTF